MTTEITPETLPTAAADAAPHAAAAATSSVPSQAQPSDPLDLLGDDHRRVDALLADGRRLAESSPADRSGLVAQVGALLTAHMQAEEDVFYPALPVDTASARKGHDAIRGPLQALSAPDLSPQAFAEQWTALAQAVHAHVAEEESQLFPAVQSLDRQALGDRLSARRSELLGPQGVD